MTKITEDTGANIVNPLLGTATGELKNGLRAVEICLQNACNNTALQSGAGNSQEGKETQENGGMDNQINNTNS